MNSESAQKGFKTFILTLSVSLLIFSVIYYVLTTRETTSLTAANPQTKEEKAKVADVTTVVTTAPAVQTPEENTSVFGKMMATNNVLGTEDTRLADSTTVTPTSGSTTTTTPTTPSTPATPARPATPAVGGVRESTTPVPETGVLSITAGLVASLVLFIGALALITANPRRIALHSFEKQITKKL